MKTSTPDNRTFDHAIAFDRRHTVFGTGRTFAECRKDACEWAGDDVMFCSPQDCLLDGHLQVYLSTEAAYCYAKAEGADADHYRFVFHDNTVSLKQSFRLFWHREDRQGSFDMGTYDSEAAAEAGIPEALSELLGQCADDEQRARIEAGTFSVEVLQ